MCCSQYGQLKGSFEVETTDLRDKFLKVANDRILNGMFAKEFMSLDKDGPGVQKRLKELFEQANHSELAEGEMRVRQRLGLKSP
jgi:ketol-acid reductoisomerase